jgi:CHAT domain-containing protein
MGVWLAAFGAACAPLPAPLSGPALASSSAAREPRAGRPLALEEARPLGPSELRLTLAAGTYVRLAVLSTAGDLVVRQQGPEGQASEELLLGGGTLGGLEPLRLSWVTVAAGEYRWTAEPRAMQSPERPQAPREPSGHVLWIEEQRPAAPCDEPRRRLERAVLAAREELNGSASKPAAARARALLEPAAREAAELGEGTAILAVRLELARAAVLVEPAAAPDLFRQALELARGLGDRSAEAAAQQGLGRALSAAGVAAAHEAALELRRQSGDVMGMVESLTDLGSYYRRQGQRQRAIQLHRQALELEWRNERGQAWTLGELGRLFGELGDLDRARGYLDAALAAGEAASDPEAQAFALRVMTGFDIDLGELQAAYDESARAYKLLVRTEVTSEAAWAAAYLATTLLYLGEPQKARQRLGEVLSDFEALADPSGRSYALLMIGSTHEAEAQPARALEYFEKALELIRASAIGSSEGMALYVAGKAHNELHQAARAVPELERALLLVTADPARQAQILVELANAYSQTEKLAAADSAFRRAIQLSGRAPVFEAAAQAGLARLERNRGELAAARAAIERALGIVERLRAGVIRPDQRVAFLASRRAYYELWVDVLMRLDRLQPGAGHGGEALAASEQARARGLLDLLARERIELSQGIPEELRRRETEVDERIARLQTRLWSASLPLPEADIQRLKRELAQAEEEGKELDAEMRRRQPAYAAVREPRPLPLAEIQRLLDERTALLEFFVGEETSYLFVVTRRGLAAHPLPARRQLEPLVGQVRSAVEQESRLRARLYAADAHELYRLLLLPAAAELKGKQLLLVAPDGPLYSLSFEALLTRAVPAGGAPGRELPFLLRERAVSYVPSASVLAQLPAERASGSQAAAAGKLFVGFGDPDAPATRPLAAAGDEIRRIAGLFPAERTAVFLGREATEENVKTGEVATARYLHFAAHGFLDDSTPELSGLRLARAGGSAQDGLLQVREVFNLKLDAELVVLSACKTGLGKEVPGEGLIGMTRAFLYAGAASVVVSLWQVDDESTSDLMVSFYQHLAAIGDKSEALRRAKLELADQSRYFQHPHYWAPFVLVGQPR